MVATAATVSSGVEDSPTAEALLQRQRELIEVMATPVLTLCNRLPVPLNVVLTPTVASAYF